MPANSLLKDVRCSNECNKAMAEATEYLTRPVIRDVRHRNATFIFTTVPLHVGLACG